MNQTLSRETVEESVNGLEIAAIHREVDELAREHDAALGNVLETMRESPNTQVNLFKVLEIMCLQSDWLHLIDRQVRLLQSEVQPEVEFVWQVGAD